MKSIKSCTQNSSIYLTKEADSIYTVERKENHLNYCGVEQLGSSSGS